VLVYGKNYEYAELYQHREIILLSKIDLLDEEFKSENLPAIEKKYSINKESSIPEIKELFNK